MLVDFCIAILPTSASLSCSRGHRSPSSYSVYYIHRCYTIYLKRHLCCKLLYTKRSTSSHTHHRTNIKTSTKHFIHKKGEKMVVYTAVCIYFEVHIILMDYGLYMISSSLPPHHIYIYYSGIPVYTSTRILRMIPLRKRVPTLQRPPSAAVVLFMCNTATLRTAAIGRSATGQRRSLSMEQVNPREDADFEVGWLSLPGGHSRHATSCDNDVTNKQWLTYCCTSAALLLCNTALSIYGQKTELAFLLVRGGTTSSSSSSSKRPPMIHDPSSEPSVKDFRASSPGARAPIIPAIVGCCMFLLLLNILALFSLRAAVL